MESGNSNGSVNSAAIAGGGGASEHITVKMGDETDSVNSASQENQTLSDADQKRKKKLELNRIASRESRKRKKRRLEELQRSVLFLTHENHQLREQNELLRQMLVGRLPGSPPGSLPAGAPASGQIAQPVVEGQPQNANGQPGVVGIPTP